MSLFIYVLSDLIHLAKIIVLCDSIVGLRGRVFKRDKLIVMMSGIAMSAISIFVYLDNNHVLETAVYVVLIILLLQLRYIEAFYKVVIVGIWTILALSMTDTMLAVLYNMLLDLLESNSEMIVNICVSLTSFLLVYGIGSIYRKRALAGIASIGIGNLICFMLLMAVNTYVVTVIAVMNVEINTTLYRELYLVAVVFVILGMFVQLAAVILLFTQRNIYKEKKLLTEKYLSEQKNHYEYLEKRELETKKFRHDFRSHLELISNLAKNHEMDEVQGYLEKLHIKIDELGNVVTVQNGIVDAILNQYYAKALQLGIRMEIKGRFPSDSEVDAYDICTIFSNILSNAIEAAEKTEEKYISVQCRYSEECIIIVVENSFCRGQQDEKLLLKTQKGDLDYHGFGLVNVKESIERYNGFLDVEIKNDRFVLKIIINRMRN